MTEDIYERISTDLSPAPERAFFPFLGVRFFTDFGTITGGSHAVYSDVSILGNSSAANRMGQPNAEVSSGGQRPAAPQQQSADRNNEEDQSWYEGENDYHDERDASAALYTNLVNTLSTLPLDELGHPCQYRDDGTFVSPGEFPAHSVSWWVGGEPEDLMSVMEGGVSAAELDAMTKGPSGWLRLSKWNGEVDGGEIEPDYLQYFFFLWTLLRLENRIESSPHRLPTQERKLQDGRPPWAGSSERPRDA